MSTANQPCEGAPSTAVSGSARAPGCIEGQTEEGVHQPQCMVRELLSHRGEDTHSKVKRKKKENRDVSQHGNGNHATTQTRQSQTSVDGEGAWKTNMGE